MVFRLDIEDDFDRGPVRDAYGTEIINIWLGEDTVLEIAVLMSVAFIYIEEGMYELVFGIEERSFDHPDWYWGRDYHYEVSKKYIPDEHRKHVLNLVLLAIKCIVNKCSPKKITMKTFHRIFPEKATEKYMKICDLLNELGYEIKEDFREGAVGRRYWLFQKSD
jgi:hypothetical protein